MFCFDMSSNMRERTADRMNDDGFELKNKRSSFDISNNCCFYIYIVGTMPVRSFARLFIFTENEKFPSKIVSNDAMWSGVRRVAVQFNIRKRKRKREEKKL